LYCYITDNLYICIAYECKHGGGGSSSWLERGTHQVRLLVSQLTIIRWSRTLVTTPNGQLFLPMSSQRQCQRA